jgi:large subunit ribosomal protein L1
VTFDLQKVVNEIKAGKVDFRVEKTGIVHATLGRVSFADEKLIENISAFMETIIRLKPTAAKGTYLKGIAISTTMGPGIQVDPLAVKSVMS